MRNELLFLAPALLLACMTGVTETNVVVGNNEWRLSPECRAFLFYCIMLFVALMLHTQSRTKSAAL